MKRKLLITFGCSWTYGYKIQYYDGMSKKEFKLLKEDDTIANKFSFRSILSEKYGFENLNFSTMSNWSNQSQFRLAEEFFSSSKFIKLQDQFDEIQVLWGITSVLRNDAYFCNLKTQKSYLYHDDLFLAKIMLTNHFDLENEISTLRKKIRFWNKVFKSIGIKNLWFDTLNHHEYATNDTKTKYLKLAGSDWPSLNKFLAGDLSGIQDKIKAEIFDETYHEVVENCYGVIENFWNKENEPRDLLSNLSIRYGMTEPENNYFVSNYTNDRNLHKVKYLVIKGILNPYSFHPTKKGHVEIAEMMSNCFNS